MQRERVSAVRTQWPGDLSERDNLPIGMFRQYGGRDGRVAPLPQSQDLPIPAGKMVVHCHQQLRRQHGDSKFRFILHVFLSGELDPTFVSFIATVKEIDKGLFLRYRFTMTNDEHNLWFKHFSADELYILQMDISFLVLYVLLLLCSFVEAQALKARHLFHRTYTLYLFSVILECCGLALLCAYYAIYAQEGYAGMELKLLGKVLEAFSTLFLLTLLIFIAKGYTVTRGRLRKQTLLKITAFLWVYIVVYVILFLYERKFFDPGEVLYIYESPAGYGIIALRLIGWAWFVYAVIFTMMHYPEKSNFYTKLFLLYSVWFLSAPVVILISTFIVPKWVREKLLNTVELFISIAAHFVFFVLTRPSKANKNFPYHVRTSQIGVMLQTNGTTPMGDNSLDKFTHHPYALTSPNPTPNYAAIFGVQANGNHRPTIEMVNAGPTQRPSAPSMTDDVERHM